MAFPPSGISREGLPCVPVAQGSDSESKEVMVIYTSRTGIYWVLALDDFEMEPRAPLTAPEPTFSVALGKYRHFKGNEYAAVVRARDPRTLANLIVYQNKEGDVWVRSEAMWLEEVEWPDGVRRARFISLEN